MPIEFDPIKRETTLAARGLDMADAGIVLAGETITVEDSRKDYGERRFITIGFDTGSARNGKMLVIVWTPRGRRQRIISIRRANERENAIYRPRFT